VLTYGETTVIQGPPPVLRKHPLAVMVGDLRDELSKRAVYPPGETSFSLPNVVNLFQDPQRSLVQYYEDFGPVFSLRLLLNRVVFMIGPEANHYMTVSHASNFTIRESHFRDLISIVGDGILTTDGEVHRSMRRIVMPAFHSESLASYYNVIFEETQHAMDALVPGAVVDLKDWAGSVVLRVSMRSLFGLDPDSERATESGLTEVFSPSSAAPFQSRLLPGPVSPWNRRVKRLRALDQFIYAEISERRARGTGGTDVVDLLIDARDEDGHGLTDVQIRDQLMTLMITSVGTTTASTCFLFYELARHPDVVNRIMAEQHAVLGDGELQVKHLGGDELVGLEMAIDESLRLHPVTWIGPRRAVEQFEFAGVSVPAGAYVDYSPLASHYLPDLFPDPTSFRPERFTPEAKAALPKGAYVPFGGGQRTCIGMRLAKLEIRAMVTLMLRRFELSLPGDFTLSVSHVPLLTPKKGLPMVVGERAHQPDPELALAG
jgi:cytochrome P450